jgi:hypothetical protein
VPSSGSPGPPTACWSPPASGTSSRSELHGSHLVILNVKLVVVVLSGLAAWLHTRAQSTAGKALLGSGTGLFALLALLLGLQLTL